MSLTIKEVQEIEEKNLPLEKLINHPSFSHVIDETNNITGAVCSIYFHCSNHPTKFLFVGVGKIKDLPFYIKMAPDPYDKKLSGT